MRPARGTVTRSIAAGPSETQPTEVRLPVPAAHERDSGLGEIGRGPMTGGVDGLDPIRGVEVVVEKAYDRLPVRRIGSRVTVRLDERVRERGQIPNDREGERGNDN